MLRGWLGLEARAWAWLERAWAWIFSSPSPSPQTGLGLAGLGPRPGLEHAKWFGCYVLDVSCKTDRLTIENDLLAINFMFNSFRKGIGGFREFKILASCQYKVNVQSKNSGIYLALMSST